ncbi:MAG TPA: ammonium transporter [Solirubrobacteraceae bacterium]|nr:ammonium transporter [Solirubrobacteraceae bacterium]
MTAEALPWLNQGDTAWQVTAATLVGLMSVPGLVVLYGGVMQKRWSINSMMLTFLTFSVVLVIWVLYAFKMGFGQPWFSSAHPGFLNAFIGKPGPSLSPKALQSQGVVPGAYGAASVFGFPESALVYFQFVFAAITPILSLGSVLGRVNWKAWCVYSVLWISIVYVVDAFLIWGGGFFAHHGALDFSGGYVIHLSAGVSGFVAAAVIGPRLQRDREIDAPNNVAMVAVGAGLLWLGWNGFNGGDPYSAANSAAAAVLNTNLATAIAFLMWVVCDLVTGRKPSLLGGVNGMIVGLVAITPAAGFVNGWGAMADGGVASIVVYFAMNYLSSWGPLRRVDDTLGVIYTHGIAGLLGGLMTGVFADPGMAVFYSVSGKKYTPAGSATGLVFGSATLLKWQVFAAAFVIAWSAVATFVILKVIGIFIPLRMSTEHMEIGDVAEHGHEVYPSDIPSLGAYQEVPGAVPATA